MVVYVLRALVLVDDIGFAHRILMGIDDIPLQYHSSGIFMQVDPRTVSLTRAML